MKLTYAAFYKGKRIELEAKTSLDAQEQAAKIFKAKRRYEVTVILLARNGEPVTHSPDF